MKNIIKKAFRLLGLEVNRVRETPQLKRIINSENFVCSLGSVKIKFPPGYDPNWGYDILTTYVDLATQLEPWFSLKKFDLLVDLGAHCGVLSTAALLEGADVIAVEPLPENVQLLNENLMAVQTCAPSAKYAVIDAAVTSDTEKKHVTFWCGSGPSRGTLAPIPEKSSRYNGETITVQTVAIKDIVSNDLFSSKKHILMKFDLEGGEYLAIDDLLEVCLSHPVKGVFGEFHPIGNDDNRDTLFLDQLEKVGFKIAVKRYSGRLEFFALKTVAA